MNKEDYFKYYIQGSDHYLIPKDIFKELFNEMINWKEESKQLKEQLLVAQTNEETFRLEMEDITQTLGLDENTLFDDVKAYARSLKDNWNKLKEKVNEGMIIYRNKNYDLVFDIEEIPKEDLNDFISYLAFQVMEQLIINLEQGSDSNEKR